MNMIQIWALLALINWPVYTAFVANNLLPDLNNFDYFMSSFIGLILALLWPITVPISLMALMVYFLVPNNRQRRTK